MKNFGFTLVEFIIYFAILATILILVGGFLWSIIFGNIKVTAYQEVQQNARFSMTKIAQEIKRAVSINVPSPGATSTLLSLAMEDPSLDPTIFDVVEGKLRITQGEMGPFELTSDRVIVENLQFTNLSYPETPGTIRIELILNHLNPAGRLEYQAQVILKSTVSLVPGGAATSE